LRPEPITGLSLTVRAARSTIDARDATDGLARDVATSAEAVDPTLSLAAHPLSERIRSATARERLLAILSGFFGGLGLLLAGLGLYGVVAYAVSRRRAEIGIRMALGASSSGVVGMIVRRMVIVVAIGIAVGGAVGVWASRYVQTLLFGLQSDDGLTFAAAAAVLMAVALAASWLPAYRATRIDMVSTLRDG
jgi:ABC-type antimicrobial peptide transport system permease subunit